MQVLVLLSSISSLFRKGTSFSHMLLPSPFRTNVHFDNSVSIGPTSVSHYKWMLSDTLCECARCQVNTLYCYIVICLPVLSHGSLKDHLSNHNACGSPKGEVSRDGLENSRQSGRFEGFQVPHEGDLHGQPGTSRETVCPDTCVGR